MNSESLNTTSVTVITNEGKEINGVFLDRFESFCQEIVKHLEGNWKLIDSDYRRYSFEWEEKGYSFCIWALTSSHPKIVEKISIDHLHRGFPKDTYWVGLSQKLPAIGCSVKKGAVKIARDLENRFMPEYERQFKIEWEKEAERSIIQSEMILILNGLCKLANLNPVYKLREGSNLFGYKSQNRSDSKFRVQVELGYRSIDCDVCFRNLSPRLAKKMLEAWNQVCEEEGLDHKKDIYIDYED